LNPCADVTGQFASKLAPTKSKSKSAFALGLPEKCPSAPKRPFRRPSETRAQEVMRHGCRESPDGLQGRTLGAGLRGGGIREGSPAPSGPYAGQAFLVPFCGGGLPPFDKRDSPEGAKQDGRADSERRRNTQAKATGLFPFGPAQALFVMEPRPAFAGMTGVGMEVRAKVREQARAYRHERAHTATIISRT